MYCHTVNRAGPFIKTKVFIMMLIVEIISLVTSIILLRITVNSYLDEFDRLEKCIKMIDNRTEDSSYTIIKSIKKDNDIFIKFQTDQAVNLMLDIATDKITIKDAAEFLKSCASK